MSMTTEEYLINEIKEEGDWSKITLQDVAKAQEVPLHVARNAISVIRYNPHIRYRFVDSRSRFKAKEYMYCEDIEEKITRVEHFSSIIYLKHITVAVTRKSTSELC